jgi:K+-transporting ATPase c subunit
MFELLVPALRASLLLWALLGLAYPFVVTGLGEVLFSEPSTREPYSRF